MKWSHLVSGGVGIALGIGLSQWIQHASSPERVGPKAASRQKQADSELSALRPKKGEDLSSKTQKGTASAPIDFDERLMTKPVADAAGFDAFLQRHDYSKEALLAAINLDPTSNRHLLEAAKRFPDDPHVQFLVITKSALPDERSEWIRRFKESQPDNAVASLLLGADLFEAGKTEEAVEQLRSAASQPRVDDFSTEAWLASDSALIEFGYTHFQAKLRSTFGHTLPFLTDFQKMHRALHAQTKSVTDPSEKIELATIGAALGNHFTQGDASGLLIHRLVGIAGERRFLMMLDPELESPNFAQTPAVMLEQLDAEQKEITEISGFSDRMIKEFSEAEMGLYLDRVRAVGELEAIRWARERLDK